MLSDMMRNGDWIDNDQITFCELINGDVFVVNGYHRLHAIIEYGGGVRFECRIINCENMDDVRRAYATFDTMTRKRSDSEILQAMNVAEPHGLTKYMTRAIYRAIPLLANNLRSFSYQTAPESVRNVLSRVSLGSEFWGYGRMYQDTLAGATPKHRTHMLICGVVAPALILFKCQAKMAKDFWSGVANMHSLGKDDPRFTLAKCLDERTYSSGTPDGMYSAATIDCSAAWNAFYENRNLSVIRTTATTNFRLAGTPWR